MSATKPCPNCELPIKANASACACGWKAEKPKPAAKAEPEADLERWRCAHEILGNRCPDAGTHKIGDRWMCALHAGRKSLADTLTAEMGPRGIARCREILAKAKPLPRVGTMVPIGQTPTFREVAHALPDNDLPWQEGRE